MQRWTTPEPLAVPIAFDRVKRLDLEFVDMRRDAGSFTAYVYLNVEDPEPEAGRDHDNFAGLLLDLRPGRMLGERGPLRLGGGPGQRLRPAPAPPPSPDQRLDGGDRDGDAPRRSRHLSVTVHAARTSDPEAREGVLRFDELTVMAYT